MIGALPHVKNGISPPLASAIASAWSAELAMDAVGRA